MRLGWILGIVFGISLITATSYIVSSGKFDSYALDAGLVKHSHNVVVIYPDFTQAAYQPKGFYDYYEKKCDTSCLTVSIQGKQGTYSSQYGYLTLKQLGYDSVTDSQVDKNPDILKKYDGIIVLHNEYVTANEYNAIITHPKVLLLYPNSLYAEVIRNDDGSITLANGHGYPTAEIGNGFGFAYDHSKLEYVHCGSDWTIGHPSDNIWQLHCNPEYQIHHDHAMWDTIDQIFSE